MEESGFEPPNPKERIYSPPRLATSLLLRYNTLLYRFLVQFASVRNLHRYSKIRKCGNIKERFLKKRSFLILQTEQWRFFHGTKSRS